MNKYECLSNAVAYVAIAFVVVSCMNSSEAHEIKPNSGNYSRLDFVDAHGKDMMAITSHIHTNKKTVVIDGVEHEGYYRHSHSTWYTRNDQGKMVHAFDVTHSEKNNQIHLYLPLIFKNVDVKLIMRTTSGRYAEIVVSDDYEIKAIPFDSQNVIKANKDFVKQIP